MQESYRNKNLMLEATIKEASFDAASENYIQVIKKILEGDFQDNAEKFKKIKLILYGKKKGGKRQRLSKKEEAELKKFGITTLEATVLRCVLGGQSSVQLAQYIHYLVAMISRYEAEKKVIDITNQDIEDKRKGIPELTSEEWKDKKFEQIGKNVESIGKKFLESLNE